MTVRAGVKQVVAAAAVALATVVVAGCTTSSPEPPAAALSGVDLAPASSSATAAATVPVGGLSVVYPDGTDRVWGPVALHDLARTSVRAADGSTVSGVSLPTLTSYEGPPATLPEVASMRTSYVVEGAQGSMRFVRAETEEGVGRHPALLTEQPDGRIDLVVSQDATTARSVLGVTRVTVDWAAAPTPVAAPERGAVVVRLGGDRAPSTLPMAALPRHPYSVTVRTSGGSRRHLEMGVSLTAVLKAAEVPMRASTLVTVVSSSGALATVTLGEEMSAKKQMGFSFAQDGSALRQPTFIVDGDSSGARTVTDVTQIVVAS